MQPRVAVLILNYNGKQHLDTCLRSVIPQLGPNDRAILVDNASTDGSIEYTRTQYPQVGLIVLDRNYGFAEAYNRAVGQVAARYLVFLNNDVEVADGWLQELIVPFSDNPNRLAATGSKLLFFSNRQLVNHGGGRLVPLGGGIDLDFLEDDMGRPTGRKLVGCVSGASMAVPREVFLKLGGFDSDFFAYFEDVDYCWRAWLAGYEVMTNPRSRVFHKVSASWGPLLSYRRVLLGERNRIQCMIKNSEANGLIVALATSLIYSLARTLDFLRLGIHEPIRAVAEAHLWNLRHLSRTIRKRQLVQTGRRLPRGFLVGNGLMTTYFEGLVEYIRLASLRSRFMNVFVQTEKGLSAG